MPEKNSSLSSSNIQNWVLIAIMIGGLIASYAANPTRAQDVERRVSNLEQQAISRNEYNELIKRLDRIEDKVDQHRLLWTRSESKFPWNSRITRSSKSPLCD